MVATATLILASTTASAINYDSCVNDNVTGDGVQILKCSSGFKSVKMTAGYFKSKTGQEFGKPKKKEYKKKVGDLVFFDNGKLNKRASMEANAPSEDIQLILRQEMRDNVKEAHEARKLADSKMTFADKVNAEIKLRQQFAEIQALVIEMEASKK